VGKKMEKPLSVACQGLHSFATIAIIILKFGIFLLTLNFLFYELGQHGGALLKSDHSSFGWICPTICIH
jgi:hypothetical protein